MPSAVRILDYLLGDGRNLAGDRQVADMVERMMPDIGLVVRLNRMFMRHAVTHLVAAGVRQFLDLSAGTTAVGNVHDVAQYVDPACRVVYVHADPVSVVHTGQLLVGAERAVVFEANPRDAEEVMAACGTLLDLTAPIGLLMVAVLEGIPRSCDLVEMVTGYRERMAPGSHLVISHFTGDHRPAQTTTVVELMRAGPIPVHPRTYEEVSRLFSGFELLAPGVVDAGRWHAERPLDLAEQLAATQYHVGVGRKPEPPPGRSS
ncbi:SAM-dependent methyltransferase [Actinophytocola sp.]|uniref:SAM-dependent methyltransferase n=1 Tax=Actinophytocola sp. TaxID=1872138 RepID=UPI00389A3DB0